MSTPRYCLLPLAALLMTVFSGCANVGSLMGGNQPVLPPAAKAAADMPAEKDPVINTQETYLSLVRQMQAKSLWFASIAHLDALDKQWGLSPDSRLLRADALRQTGQLNAAVPIYQSLLGSGKDGAARYGLGRVAAEIGDFRKAAQHMEHARLSNPVDPRLLTDLGYAYLRARDLNAARIPLMQAAQLDPEDAQANVNLSLFLIVNGQAPEAMNLMQQRKLDAQTQQAVKEQASQWLKSAPQGVAQAQPLPAEQASGKVVNLSKPQVQAPAQTSLKAPAAAQPEVAANVPPEREAQPVKQAQPEPELAQRTVENQPQQPAPAMAAQTMARAPGSSAWMVSGSSFDSARPRYPGAASQQRESLAAPTPVQQAASAVASFANQPVVVAEPVVAERKPASVPTAHQEPVRLVQTALRQPTGVSRTLQDPPVVLAAASPAAVRQVAAPVNSQQVQTMLARRPAAGGLYFETPDEPAPSRPVTASRTTERVWP